MTAEWSHADPARGTSSDVLGASQTLLWPIVWKRLLTAGQNSSSRQSVARMAKTHGFGAMRLLPIARRRRRWHLLRLTPLCALVLAACAGNPPKTFDLDPSVQFAHVRRSQGQLAVYEPTASLPLETQRVVVRTGPGTIAYLHGAQWASDLPSLVQDRLIGGFEAAHILRAVGRPGLLADRSLNTDIQHFEVDVTRKQAIVEIYARLVAGNGRVVADKLFSATAAVANDHATTITKALNQAFAEVVHNIVIWAAPRV